MHFDSSYLPYPSMRYPVYARNGMVASSSPQASAAGLAILQKGGNAVDAAVAAAAALTVVEPTSNGIGSDAFALVWIEREQKLYGLNASGWAPANISIEKVLKVGAGYHNATQSSRPSIGAQAGLRETSIASMPMFGWIPTTVPGAPSAWAELVTRFGALSLAEVVKPAVQYAQEGYPVSANLARMWKRAFEKYRTFCSVPEFEEWFRVFAPEGHVPEAGEIVHLPDHADTLKLIGTSNAEAFYRGELAARIVEDSDAFGGFFSKEDFETYRASWVEPISTDYRGYTVAEIPPNGQGIVALMALNILNKFDFKERESAQAYHLQWEAMKLAFADGLAYVTDPASMCCSCRDFLQADYSTLRAQEIDVLGRAKLYAPGTPPSSGTVYLCTADAQGNMVSYIQSNYMGFGSGIVVRGTGISLQNRGADFSLDPLHPNCLAPRKKTYHTIIPGFLLQDGRALGPFGVMGGYMQPQGHVQVVMNLIDFGLNPQQALDAPRWQWVGGLKFLVERGFRTDILTALAGRGHDIEVSEDSTPFGRGQIILRLPNGTLIGGSEGRTDSSIACW